jgi:hypothetical protein
LHAICRWLGNSPAVASQRYLQVTREDYDRAAAAGIALNMRRNRERQGAILNRRRGANCLQERRETRKKLANQ